MCVATSKVLQMMAREQDTIELVAPLPSSKLELV